MFRREVAAQVSACASSLAASSRAADRYCGIANGVSGAFAFLIGFVAIQATTAGLNSARNRSK